jgi:hypothetical protein
LGTVYIYIYDSDNFAICSPFNQAFKEAHKKACLRGRWNADEKLWVFPRDSYGQLLDLAKQHCNISGSNFKVRFMTIGTED